MNRTRLMEVLNDSTCLISKGASTYRKMPGIPVLLWGLLLSQTDPQAAKFQQVDCHFIAVGVNPEQAEKYRAEFVDLLESYPDAEKLLDGPSYKSVASVVGDEITALRMFGLGQVLGLWQVVLPDQFDVPPESMDEAVDLGLIVTTGYRSRQLDLRRTAVG